MMSAFKGSAGENHLHERQFSVCQVILFKSGCDDGMVVSAVASELMYESFFCYTIIECLSGECGTGQ